jgi:hypothetical protein
MARLSSVAPGDADGFTAVLDRVIRDTLTADYWDITLPNDLATSASKSPALLGYIAALNILDADILMSTSTVRSRLDPAVTRKKGIERHHLFPRAYLKSVLGISDTKRINQIANYALVDWVENIAIGDLAPAVYWPEQVQAKGLAGASLQQAMYWHALPEGWTEMAYEDFLAERRKLMAIVVRDALARLEDVNYLPAVNGSSEADASGDRLPGSSLRDLVDADLIPSGTTLVTEDTGDVRVAQVLPDGRLYAEGDTYDGMLELSDALGVTGNPWSAWAAELDDGRLRLGVVREAYRDSDSHSAP